MSEAKDSFPEAIIQLSIFRNHAPSTLTLFIYLDNSDSSGYNLKIKTEISTHSTKSIDVCRGPLSC